VGKLSDEQRAQLEELEKLRDAPDEPAGGRTEAVSIHIDLSDPDAVDRAVSLGYLTRAEAEELADDDDDADGGDGKKKATKQDADDAPKRRRGNVLTRGYGDE